MKSTTLLIDGRKTKFTYDKLKDYYYGNKLIIKQEQTRYAETSFGLVKIEHMHVEKMFKLIYEIGMTKYLD